MCDVWRCLDCAKCCLARDVLAQKQLNHCCWWLCRTEDGIVNRWLFVRYLVIGLYVGCVTCAGFAWWYTWAPVSHTSPLHPHITCFM